MSADPTVGLPGKLATLLSAAVLAPSGDNRQPWHFTVDSSEGLLGLDVDPNRDSSPMNAGQRMARIAVGAALENMVRTARANQWQMELLDPGPHAALVHIADVEGPSGVVEPAIRARVTNRRVYEPRPLPADVLNRFAQATQAPEGVRTCWISQADQIGKLAAVIGQCDRAMFCQSGMRRAFVAHVRLDAEANSAVTEGLPTGSLELGRGSRWLLRLLAHGPPWILHCGALHAIAAQARRLVQSASGLCVITASDDRPDTDIRVGQATQRAWLAMTEAGLAAQPMMSLPVLDNARGNPNMSGSLVGRVNNWQRAFRLLAPEIGEWRIAFILRFGYAPTPTARTGRRHLHEALRIAARPAAVI
jgi:hypothetical protein